ncbi:hypothetical protein AXX12_14715 [Anaerosporomusa subterranea]|uniref:Uncharacterized protein n=1 Tax=Anaerosporomusa subterranea TaxID=1794912 RepID=A0A154BN41_ANASB|nr:ATP synthase subunit I [Anaerosporomusa subterranea]KYZ75397.1 hypothetical protein AXX12_14715 [Anaerosporomusa subterranea]
MNELGFGLKRTLSVMVSAGLFMCTVVLLSHRADILPGLLIGIAASCLYYLLLYYQIKKDAFRPVQADACMNEDAFSRFYLLLVGIVLVVRDPGPNLIAFLAGIILPFRLILSLSRFFLLQKQSREQRPSHRRNH